MRIFKIEAKYDDPPEVGFVEVAAFPETATRLVDGDELVTDLTAISIRFDYPLNNPATLEFANTRGFTRRDIYRCIYEGYRYIYNKEEATAGPPPPRPADSLLMNRTQTDGPYGIWGHVIEDLFIEEVGEFGPGKFELAIGS